MWKTNEEEDRQILQGGNEKMRRSNGEIEEGKRGEKAEISSSGFSLRPPVKVNEGWTQSSESDYITAPLINTLSVCFPPHTQHHVCTSILVQLHTHFLLAGRRPRTDIASTRVFTQVCRLCSTEHPHQGPTGWIAGGTMSMTNGGQAGRGPFERLQMAR